MESIRFWLNGDQDYRTGVQLYVRYGNDPGLKNLFSGEAATGFKRTKLYNALLELYQGNSYEPPTLNDTVTAIEETGNRVEDGLRELYLAKFKQMQDLRSQLLLLGNDQDRRAAAFAILKLDEECNMVLSRRDYYLQNGQLPEAATGGKIAEDPLQMGYRVQSLRRYIRREKNILKKEPNNAKAAKRLQAFIMEINIYLKLLKMPLYAD